MIITIGSIRDARTWLSEPARQVDAGETLVVTCNGRPIVDPVPNRPQSGLRSNAIDVFKARHVITTIVADIAADFDAPLAEDFLISRLPND